MQFWCRGCYSDAQGVFRISTKGGGGLNQIKKLVLAGNFFLQSCISEMNARLSTLNGHFLFSPSSIVIACFSIKGHIFPPDNTLSYRRIYAFVTTIVFLLQFAILKCSQEKFILLSDIKIYLRQNIFFLFFFLILQNVRKDM